MASSAPAEGKKKIILQSSDGMVFEVDEAAAKQSLMIDHMIEMGCDMNIVPLAKVNGDVLAKIVEYMNKHATTAVGDGLDAWDTDYAENVDRGTLFGLISAAEFMNMNSLVDLCCRAAVKLFFG